jgi:hypothetical protein
MQKLVSGQRACLFLASLLCIGTAYASRGSPPLMGLISLPALLAAFAGAGLILSFLPPSQATAGRLIAMIVCCTALGVLAASVAVRVAASYVPDINGPGAEILAAFLVAAVAQVMIPPFVKRRESIVNVVTGGKS